MIRHKSRHIRRALIIAGAVTGSFWMPVTALAAPGGTGHTVTETNHIHGEFDPQLGDPNPCTGAAVVSASAVGNVVEHVTFFPDDDEVWATFTETAKVTIVDSNGVTLTGRLTAWDNFNLNERNTNSTFTLTIQLTGSDGSTIVFHEVQHFGTNANGAVTAEFDKPRLTCG